MVEGPEVENEVMRTREAVDMGRAADMRSKHREGGG